MEEKIIKKGYISLMQATDNDKNVVEGMNKYHQYIYGYYQILNPKHKGKRINCNSRAWGIALQAALRSLNAICFEFEGFKKDGMIPNELMFRQGYFCDLQRVIDVMYEDYDRSARSGRAVL